MKSLQGDNFRQTAGYFLEFQVTPGHTQRKLNDSYIQNSDEQLNVIEKQCIRQQQALTISKIECELLVECEDDDAWSISYLESKIELKKAMIDPELTDNLDYEAHDLYYLELNKNI